MDTKECEGCAALQEENPGGCYLRDFIRDKNIDVECPCLKCIVKGVCIFDTCSAYHDFDNKLTGQAVHYWKKDETSI